MFSSDSEILDLNLASTHEDDSDSWDDTMKIEHSNHYALQICAFDDTYESGPSGLVLVQDGDNFRRIGAFFFHPPQEDDVQQKGVSKFNPSDYHNRINSDTPLILISSHQLGSSLFNCRLTVYSSDYNNVGESTNNSRDGNNGGSGGGDRDRSPCYLFQNLCPVALWTGARGKDHSDTLTSVFNLTYLYQRRFRLDEADKLHLTALDEDRKAYTSYFSLPGASYIVARKVSSE
ncbi:hypothetical protein HJFPF1_10782 [Paramyrothecium foliicola]|nr:hypothetical protein HJFPF1_10782 [Paramyrothecium foliicola]